jgi:hypothetical protein
LSWAEWWWRVALTLQIGAREHRAANPWRISLTTIWPRALLMCLFFTMLGRVIAGDVGQSYTFVGAVAIVLTLFTVSEICDVPMRDRWSAAFYRLRAGVLSVPLTYWLRVWPLVAEASAVAALCILLVGAVTGQLGLASQLLALLPVYALMVLSSAAAGLAAASVALFGRAGNDVIVGNVGMYLIIVTSSALIPPGRVPLIDVVGSVLPMRHGILAIHAHLAGEPWLGLLLTEVAVGVGWAVLATVSYLLMTARVRHTDHDDVT